MSSIAVIGGGVGGLTVAARLARVGHQVTVFEQAETVGGKLGLLEAEGFRFDTGPSLVTMPEVFRELWTFLEVGRSFDDDLQLRRLDPIARYRMADGSWFDAWADPDAFTREVDRLGAGNGAEMRKFLERAGKIWNVTREPFLESPLHGLRSLLALATRVGDLRTISPGTTLRRLSNGYLSDPRMVDFIDRYATYTGSDPRKVPAALASIPFVERSFGGWYVEGGLRRIADRLEELCRRLGVVIRCGTGVVAITLEGDRASGVKLSTGHSENFDLVVANADARSVYEDLLPPVGPVRKARRAVRRAQPSFSGFVMLLGVKGRVPGVAHHTVLFPENYDAEFDDLFGTKSSSPQTVQDPTIYLSVPDDALVAPAGHQAWFVLVNAPRHAPGEPARGVDWSEVGLAERYGDRMLRLMADRGVEVRDRIVYRSHRTPADIERDTLSVGGSIYGSSSNGMNAAFLRPANESPVRNLYLVGGSSHPGGGLPLVVLSARIVSQLIGST